MTLARGRPFEMDQYRVAEMAESPELQDAADLHAQQTLFGPAVVRTIVGVGFLLSLPVEI
jgi:hypothetical protein